MFSFFSAFLQLSCSWSFGNVSNSSSSMSGTPSDMKLQRSAFLWPPFCKPVCLFAVVEVLLAIFPFHSLLMPSPLSSRDFFRFFRYMCLTHFPLPLPLSCCLSLPCSLSLLLSPLYFVLHRHFSPSLLSSLCFSPRSSSPHSQALALPSPLTLSTPPFLCFPSILFHHFSLSLYPLLPSEAN